MRSELIQIYWSGPSVAHSGYLLKLAEIQKENVKKLRCVCPGRGWFSPGALEQECC